MERGQVLNCGPPITNLCPRRGYAPVMLSLLDIESVRRMQKEKRHFEAIPKWVNPVLILE